MSPHYKILSESGELTNMVIEGYDAQNTNSFFAQLSAVGKYKITSENTMNEEIENHVQSIFKGKTTKMTFKVVENKYLFLSYNIEKDSLGKNIDINSIETWVRVEFPQQINLKVN